MKLFILTLFVLSIVCLIHCDSDYDPNEYASNPEDPLTEKDLQITCNNQYIVANCRNAIYDGKAEYETPDKFSSAVFNYFNQNQLSASYRGSCSKAIEALRAVPNCGMTECSEVDCNGIP